MIQNEATYHHFAPDAEHPIRQTLTAASVANMALPVPWVDPADTDTAVLFLASGEARHITGAALLVDASHLVKYAPSLSVLRRTMTRRVRGGPSEDAGVLRGASVSTARRGALGGSSNEAGANHRAGIAALVAVHGLLGERVPWLRSAATPVLLRMEADLHVDDVVVDLADGTRAFVQAKLNASDKAFKDSADQWCRAVASGECRPGDELLYIVTRSTPALDRMAEALTLHQSGASPTLASSRQLDRLRSLATDAGLDHADTDRLLAAARVRALDARDGGPDEAFGAACLNAAVVTAGHGRAAFRAMKAAARVQAEQRTASDPQQWRGWLLDAHLPLVADASGALAARLEAMDREVATYRERWAAERDVLPLADLGQGLKSMTVPGAAKALRAVTPAKDQNRGRDTLVNVVRRQGRLFLVGPPGSGKTVASHLLAAHWAGHAHAPVPLWLPLRELVPLLPPAGPYRLDPADLVRAAIGTARPLLVEALVSHVRQGNALLLLDALDEVHDRQDAVVEAVAHVLHELPAELDVVVTSRHSSAAAAAHLRLPVHELLPPEELTDTLDHLLETLAERFTDAQGRRDWIADRARRVEHSRRAERALWRVPLLATLMVLLIAERPAAALPGSRAQLLTEVIDASVRRWEMRRGSPPTMPDTDAYLTAEILIDCFDDIAHVVAAAGTASWHDAHQAVGTRLRKHWGKPPGVATAIARHTLEYWDAAAGVFITNTPQGTLTARTRLFAEIGDARWAVRDTRTLPSWMEAALANPERREAARLAANLSPQAADSLIESALAAGDETLLDLVHAALTDGTSFDSGALHRYREAQLARLPHVPDHYPTSPGVDFDLSAGLSPRAELAGKIAEEDLEPDQARQLIEFALGLGPKQHAVITALCIQRQATQHSGSPTSDELDIIEAGLVAAASADSQADEYIVGADPLVRFAIEHLLPPRPHVLPHVKKAARLTTLDTYEWVETELSKLGHAGPFAEWGASNARGALRQLAEMSKSLRRVFDDLATLDVSPVQLAPAQRWHLDDAAAFIAALNLRRQSAAHILAAVGPHAELTRALLRHAAAANNIDRALLAAQLRSLRDENPQHPNWGLLYCAATRTPSLTFTHDTVDSELTFATLATGNNWLIELGLKLAGNAHTWPQGLAERLLHVLPDLDAFARLSTAGLLTYRRPDLALPRTDAVVRAGASRMRALKLAKERRHSEARDILRDPDLLVRTYAAARLRDASPDDLAVLKEALAVPPDRWTCMECEAPFPSAAERCPEGHHRPVPALA
ncbi:NACHT domain-containing protein [Streptomyces exfoliatus]|uniref:NACHT domain-containing protein n=1 Tax=Streptomyces exfoliatus TaxID=1905 RepID=UPI000466E91C|nr:NACHT domain-containing protein [Streptomyces exfoliatus]